MNNNFSIVNLYRITNGNLSIFDKLWIEKSNSVFNSMYSELENNHNIIKHIVTTKHILSRYVFTYLIHIRSK